MQCKKLKKAMLAVPAVRATKTTTITTKITESTIVADTTTFEIHEQDDCNNNDHNHINSNSNNNYQFNYTYSSSYSNNYRLNNNNNNKNNKSNKHKLRNYRHATQSIETVRAIKRRKTMAVNDTSAAAAAARTVNTTKETTTTTAAEATTRTITSAHNTSGSYSLTSDTFAGVLNLFLLNVTLLTAAATTTTDFASLIDDDGSDLQLVSNGNNVSSSSSSNYNTTTAITTTNLNEPHMEYIFDNTYIRILFIVLYTLCFCCCVFGNLLVILVVTCSRRLRSITNFFLANLALADFCVGVFCVMQNLSIYLIDSWVFGEFLCRMYQFVHSLSYTASIFILVVICMERYFAIVHPITCKQILTAARLRIVILTVWITAAVYSTPKFVFSKTIQNVHDDGHEEEICVLDRKMYNSKLLDMINFVLLYAIPLLVMTVLYSKIAITLWRSSRGFSHHIAQQQDNGMGMHNSMYHHHPHHHHHQHHLHHHHHREQLQQQQQTPNTPIMGNSSGSMLSRKQSSKYEKRGVSITESQVSLESDRPIVSTCRNKTSFYQHHNHHNHHHLPQQSQQHPQQPQQRHGGAQRGASHMSHSSNNVLRARRGVVRMLIIFVLTFAICNLPIHARKMWQYWGQSYRGDSNFNALLTPLTFLFSYFNSGVNPLLYAFLSRNFRKGMKELLLCSWKKSKGKSSTNSLMHHKRAALQTHSLPTDTTHIGNDQL